MLNYVAVIGGEKYETLQEAVTAAQSGDTIDLVADVNVTTGWKLYNLPANVTINGNNYSLNFDENGSYRANSVFKSSGSYAVKDLTINYKSSGIQMAFVMYYGGTLENVTVGTNFNMGVYAGGNVKITGCTFNTIGHSIYTENHQAVLTIEGNIFEGSRAGMLHTVASGTFKNNLVKGDNGLSLNSANVQVKNNVFTGARALSISTETEISDNIFGANTCVELNASADLSGNYWGGNKPNVVIPDDSPIPADQIEITIDRYYTELTPNGGIDKDSIMIPGQEPEENPDEENKDDSIFEGLTDEEILAIMGAIGAIGSQNGANAGATASEGLSAWAIVAIVCGSLVVVIAAAACVLWVLDKKGILKVTNLFKKNK